MPLVKTFVHKDYNCIIFKHQFGHLCGYTQLPESHIETTAKTPSDLVCYKVHGGITFGPAPLEFVPEAPKDALFIGFDCAHAGDYVPALRRNSGEVYRNAAFVETELRGLVEQLRVADWTGEIKL